MITAEEARAQRVPYEQDVVEKMMQSANNRVRRVAPDTDRVTLTDYYWKTYAADPECDNHKEATRRLEALGYTVTVGSGDDFVTTLSWAAPREKVELVKVNVADNGAVYVDDRLVTVQGTRPVGTFEIVQKFYCPKEDVATELARRGHRISLRRITAEPYATQVKEMSTCA